MTNGEGDVPYLLWQLENGASIHPDLQWEASIKLGERLKDTQDLETKGKVIEAMVSQLDSPKPHCALLRAHVIQALGRLGAKEKSQNIIRHLDDRYYLTRSYAAKALGQLRVEEAIPFLLDRIENDSFGGVRAESVKSIRLICENNPSEICQRTNPILSQLKEKEEKRPIPQDERDKVIREFDIALKQSIA
jgi:HEAT repeat protein